jgi:hypothetical protein
MAVGTPLGVSAPGTGGENIFKASNGSASYGSFVPHQGYQTRDSRAYPGNNAEEIAFSLGVETPFFAGTDGSIEPDHDVEVEGNSYILSAATTLYPDGTSAATDAGNSALTLTAGTAINTELCFRNGLFCLAVSTDLVTHILMGQKTPTVTGNIRIAALRIGTYRKP